MTDSSHSTPTRIPFNFSWVVDGFLGGMGYPREEAHFRYLANQGVKYLISLTETPPSPPEGTGLEIVSIPIVDFTPPSLDQVQKFLGTVDKAKDEGTAAVVHCMMGRGRTGAMLGCYLIRETGVSADQAIRDIRRMRPGSLETREQEELLSKYERHFKS